MKKRLFLVFSISKTVSGFWDMGTTTIEPNDTDITPRQSFFRWEYAVSSVDMTNWVFGLDWDLINMNKQLRCIAGISIDFIPLSVAVILNKRTLLTAANFMESIMNRQKDLRVWALGRGGSTITPYRYRVWRVRRVFPKSNNPEHRHGPTGEHVPRHDVAIIHTLDQMYVTHHNLMDYNYPRKAILTQKYTVLYSDRDRIWFAASGFMSFKDIRENYRIKHGSLLREDIVDCSKYLPKWWGKFICMVNVDSYPGIQNGATLFITRAGLDIVVGIGCFEIRYNEDRIFVFTDLRYYVDPIHINANITPGDYYEYAYPKWATRSGLLRDDHQNMPYIPRTAIDRHMFPLGRR